MKRTLLLSVLPLLMLIPGLTNALYDPYGNEGGEKKESKEMKVTADLSMFEYTPKSLKKAAFLAFLRRNWDVESAQDNHFVGKMDTGSSQVKVEMIISDHQLEIKTVKGFGLPKESWLTNLKKDFLVFLVENSY